MSEEKNEEQLSVPEKFQTLVAEIETMAVLDLAELVKILEKKFGVSAVAPAMMMADPVNGAAAQEEEKTQFDIELTSAGANKIALIKAIRTVSELGLKEAKDLADGAPKMFKTDVAKDEANKIKTVLEEAGGKVTLK